MVQKILTRVSTQGQVRDGYSLAYQRDEITRYCADNAIELVHIYEDKGISGAKVDEDGLTVEREGLQSMLVDLATVSVDYVVVLNTSRLWRSDMAKVLIQRELKRHRVDVRAIEQQTYSIYNYDPNDFLVNGMLELLDQYQRLEIALKQIASQLNQEGLTTRQGSQFRKVHVKRILDHESTYRGMIHYGQIEAVGLHQTIILKSFFIGHLKNRPILQYVHAQPMRNVSVKLPTSSGIRLSVR